MIQVLNERKNKISRFKLCVECNKLIDDSKTTMSYQFKSQELYEQWENTDKYIDGNDIENYLNLEKPYGYICDYCI